MTSDLRSCWVPPAVSWLRTSETHVSRDRKPVCRDIGNPRWPRGSVVSKARLVITAVVLEGRSQAEAAAAYGVSKGWVSKLIARYRAEGESAFTPRSRR